MQIGRHLIGLVCAQLAICAACLPARAGITYTAIDLNPSGFSRSIALGVSDDQQVGSGSGPATGGITHALLWTGSPDHFVDLQSFLPAGFTTSVATGIDAHGDISGYAAEPSGQDHAVLWLPASVPLPSAAWSGLLVLAGILIATRARAAVRSRASC